MNGEFRLEILTPAGVSQSRMVLFLDVPGTEGRLTVLAGHAPIICLLEKGPVRIREAGEAGEEHWEIGPGTLEVARSGVTLLVREFRPESTESSR